MRADAAERSAAASATAAHTPPPHLTEAQLETLWRGQRFPREALVTRQGVPVRVIFQGRRGRGPGPDFRGARIAGPSGAELRGDVELHVRASDFIAHGHHRDRAYANVILHVVFLDDAGADTLLPGGRRAPVVALAPWVARRAQDLQRWLERPLLWREPCHDAVMRMGAAGVAAALEAEGDRRFEARVDRARDAVRTAGLEDALYEGLLEGLGYGGNAPQMLALARLLPWQRLAALAPPGPGRRFRMEALLLGSAALLPSQRGHRGPPDPYAERLEETFAVARLPSLAPGLFKTWGVRPENAPCRRIAAAAALLDSLGQPSALLARADAATTAEAVAPLLAVAQGYWRHHYDLCAGPCRLPPALCGRGRALEILINAALPVAVAWGAEPHASAARRLYARLPRPAAYGRTRFLEEALASEGVRVAVNARRAQGLLALHKDWCTQGGCGRCPLSP